MFPHSLARSASLGLLLLACASEPTPPAQYAPREAPLGRPLAADSATLAATEPPAPPPSPPAPPVQVVAAEPTPIEGQAPTVQLRAPRHEQVIKSELVQVSLAVKNWVLSPQGNHLHLIVDDEPYIAIRETDKPIDLRALLQKEFGHDLSEGSHLLRVFAGRAHHESVKEAGAFDRVVFHFKKKSDGVRFDAKAPLLTYSRPKGCVTLGERALLDFYVTNTTLGATTHRVRVHVDGADAGDIVAWTPHYIENLAEGAHTLRLSLVNDKGEPVPGPSNDITRTIHVQTDCKATTPTLASPSPSPSPAALPAPAVAAPAGN